MMGTVVSKEVTPHTPRHAGTQAEQQPHVRLHPTAVFHDRAHKTHVRRATAAAAHSDEDILDRNGQRLKRGDLVANSMGDEYKILAVLGTGNIAVQQLRSPRKNFIVLREELGKGYTKIAQPSPEQVVKTRTWFKRLAAATACTTAVGASVAYYAVIHYVAEVGGSIQSTPTYFLQMAGLSVMAGLLLTALLSPLFFKIAESGGPKSSTNAATA